MKDNRDIIAGKQITDPGKGKRSPAVWGRWLLDKMGFQRQMLNALQGRPMFQGYHDDYRGDHQRKVLAKRRAKNKMARRSRQINRAR